MAFKIGDIVMRLDGDGRPHKIVDITVHYPLNSKEYTFFQYHYEDGGSDVAEWADNLRLYDGKYKKNKKIMTQEEKAKAYDEAIKRAKDALNDGTISNNTIAYLQDVFPELKDSEDERMRKGLIAFLEVDLDEEIKSFTMSKELYEADSAIKAVAEHFFELGLNTLHRR